MTRSRPEGLLFVLHSPLRFHTMKLRGGISAQNENELLMDVYFIWLSDIENKYKNSTKVLIKE